MGARRREENTMKPTTTDPMSERQMVERDMREAIRSRRDHGLKTDFLDKDQSNWPAGDGSNIGPLTVTIGIRGDLTEQAAQDNAKRWRAVVERYPKASFIVIIPGYDHDPRELWDIPEAADYVRRWAHHAGMDDLDVADDYLGPLSAIGQTHQQLAHGNLGFLAACGVFGDENKAKALAGFKSGLPVKLVSEPEQFPTGLPLFELSPSIIQQVVAMKPEDRAKMLADMQEAGVLRLPYDRIAVRFWWPDIQKVAPAIFVTFFPEGEVKILDKPISDTVITKRKELLIFLETTKKYRDKFEENAVAFCGIVLTVLVISLATRNTVKNTERNTRIHNKHKQSKEQFRGPNGAIYISHTRIEAPRVEDMVQEHDGGTKRPHLRRGHAHTVTFGIRHREREVRWFPAIFVNGDPNHSPPAPRYVVQE